MATAQDVDHSEKRSFAPGEKVWVHDSRPPFSLRRATVIRAEVLDSAGLPVYAVETGLGGEIRAETTQMHHLSDQPPVAGCSHCAANPDAANSRRG